MNISQENILVFEADSIELMEKLYNLYKIPQMKQKSKDWLDQRNKYLTASTINAALSNENNANRLNLLANKVSNGEMYKFTGNSATHWGVKYEPVANMIYSMRNNVVVHEFGLIPSLDPRYPILAVSPDGICSNGKMLEIKCPYSRTIDGKIKADYLQQMQEQLTVCQFDICDFLECKFVEVSEDIFWGDFHFEQIGNREKGLIITFLRRIYTENGEATEHYETDRIYSPCTLSTDDVKLKEWENEKLLLINTQMAEQEETIYLSTTYWKLDTYMCQEVKRDTKWLENNYPTLENFWNKVVEGRNMPLEQFMEVDKKMRKPKSPPATPQSTPPASPSTKRSLCLLNDEDVVDEQGDDFTKCLI